MSTSQNTSTQSPDGIMIDVIFWNRKNTLFLSEPIGTY